MSVSNKCFDWIKFLHFFQTHDEVAACYSAENDVPLLCQSRNSQEKLKTLFIARLNVWFSQVKRLKNCNLYLDAKLKSTKTTDQLQSQLTKISSITSIGKRRSQINKFEMKDFPKLIKSKKREQRGLMNRASDKALLVFVTAINSKTQKLPLNFMEVYQTFAMKSSVSKVLLVTMTNS